MEQRLKAASGGSAATGVFQAFFQLLAEQSRTAHLAQLFDSTVVRAHVSAAGTKGGSKIKRSAAHAVASRPKSISRPTSRAICSISTQPWRGER